MTARRAIHTRYDVVDGWRIHSLASPAPATTPSDGALVLVHGLGMSTRYLAPTLEELARHHHVVALDLPGCGRSSRPARPLDLGELADAVVAWMGVVGLEHAVVIGHSIGSQVAVHLAERHPERARALVLASPTGDPDASRARQSIRLLVDSAREAPRLIPVAVRDYVRAGPLRMWRTLGLATEDGMADRLRRLQHRCLVVRGSDDDVVTAAWTDVVASAARADPVVTIPEAPHGLPFSAPLELTAAINGFLAHP